MIFAANMTPVSGHRCQRLEPRTRARVSAPWTTPVEEAVPTAVSRRLVAGLDLGSTGIKILIADDLGNEVLVRQQPTPWRPGAGGTTELDSDDLLSSVRTLLSTAAADLRDATRDHRARVDAVAVS